MTRTMECIDTTLAKRFGAFRCVSLCFPNRFHRFLKESRSGDVDVDEEEDLCSSFSLDQSGNVSSDDDGGETRTTYRHHVRTVYGAVKCDHPLFKKFIRWQFDGAGNIKTRQMPRTRQRTSAAVVSLRYTYMLYVT